MKLRDSLMTRLAKAIDENTFQKLWQALQNALWGNNLSVFDDIQDKHLASEQYGDYVGIYLPIEKAILAEARPYKNSESGCIIVKVTIRVEDCQYSGLIDQLTHQFNAPQNNVFSGEKLEHFINTRILQRRGVFLGYDGITSSPNVKLVIDRYNDPKEDVFRKETSRIEVDASVVLEIKRKQQHTATGSTSATGNPLNTLVLQIHDSNGKREVTIHKFPISAGRNCVTPDIVVAGKYVSSVHLTLNINDKNQLVVTNISKTNELFHNGRLITPNTSGDKSTIVAAKDVIRISRVEAQNFAEFPELTIIQWQTVQSTIPPVGKTPTATVTPTVPITPPEVPITNMFPLFKVELTTFEGTRTIAVSKEPCLIGRTTEKSDAYPTLITVPSKIGNTVQPHETINTVSREHLVIHRVAENKLLVDNHGSNGSFLNGQRQPKQFELNAGQELTLGADTHPVKIKIIIDAECFH